MADVDADIRRARTPHASLYRDPRQYRAQLERVFARSWQLVPEAGEVNAPGDVRPWTLLPGSLDEPLLLTRDERGELHSLSNVCTHRGNLVVAEPCRLKGLRCGYHGRRFALDGRFRSMPEFEAAEDFPSKADDLPSLPVERWGPLVFTGCAPQPAWPDWIGPVRDRLEWLPIDAFRLDPATCRDYVVDGNWILYCDNFLEGFHIPFVHEGLAAVLDYGSYRTELFEHGSLQVGIAEESEPSFRLPDEHPDAGQRVAAYYFWLFPNLMLNFYPWGLSVNVVMPQAIDRTVVRFLSWVHDPAARDAGAGADLHTVELEDEAVVQRVQRGIRSRLYTRGRYSPTREIGVHHFHRLLTRSLADREVR